MKIGFIGLGAMGGALARQLVAENSLVVCDLNQKAVETLVQLGASPAKTPADLGRQCELVFLCLPRSSNVKTVLFGPDGLADALSSGAIVVDHTSGIPEVTAGIAKQLASRGIAMIDAPVAGGVPSALAGRATIMVSGSREIFEQAAPVLKQISPKVHYCSDRVGDAQAVKIVNNSINAGNRVATLEIVALGRKLGLSLPAMTDALNNGRAANFIARVLLTALVQARPSNNFALSLMLKDVNQAMDLAIEAEAPMPITSIARGLFQVGVNMLGEQAQLDDIVRVIETMSGTKLMPQGDASEQAVGDPAEQAEFMRLIISGVAACNRAVVYENLAMGVKFGLNAAAMGKIVNDGSGWSEESVRMFAGLDSGESASDFSLGQVVDDLTALTRLAIEHGAPMLIANDVRAIFEAHKNLSGASASPDSLQAHYESAAKVRLGG